MVHRVDASTARWVWVPPSCP